MLPTRYEPVGLTPLEAGACGVPALFSRLAGISDVLPDGQAALHLENPLDAVELAEKMGRLAADAGLRWFLTNKSFAIVTTSSGSKPNFL